LIRSLIYDDLTSKAGGAYVAGKISGGSVTEKSEFDLTDNNFWSALF